MFKIIKKYLYLGLAPIIAIVVLDLIYRFIKG